MNQLPADSPRLCKSPQGGLNRYDGYKFKIYKPEVDNPNSLSHVFVTALIEVQTDTGRVFWIGTDGGGFK